MPVTTSHTATVSNELTMEQFLIDIEKKAYRMVEISVRDHGEAMDILQEGMIKLVTNYSDKPSQQWKPLFYRILNNKITDWHRHQKVKNLLFFWKSEKADDNEEALDLIDNIEDKFSGQKAPVEALEKLQQQESVVEVLSGLSVKQQQCFMLRSWEGMSVAETANIMGCSEGSVKTHYSRAVHKIKQMLEVEHDYTF